MDVLIRIKRAVLAGRYAFSEKARLEMEIDDLTELDIAGGFVQKVVNPTHGSGWIGSGPFYRHSPKPFDNPTHGSGWIFQILS